MAEPAARRMTLEEFLAWDDGTDILYELDEGFPVAMAPPAEAHRILAVRLALRIDAALADRRPCNAQIDAGVTRADRADSYYIADIAVIAKQMSPDNRRSESRSCWSKFSLREPSVTIAAPSS